MARVGIGPRRQARLTGRTGLYIAATTAAIIVPAALALAAGGAAGVVVGIIVVIVVANFSGDNVAARLPVIAPRALRAAGVVFGSGIVAVKASEAIGTASLGGTSLLTGAARGRAAEFIADGGVGTIKRHFSTTA